MSAKKVKKTNYKEVQGRLSKSVSSSFKNADAQNLIDQLKSGDNEYLKYQRFVNTSYDNRWIDEIEGCLYELGEIIKNPKKITKEVTDVVPVEVARKTNSESITHLSTHSQFVKELTEDGDVIPNKILNIGSDDFYQTYENRFIATLIRKLVIFVEKRYQFLQQNNEIKKSQVLYVKNKSIVDGREVEIETKVTVSNNEIAEGLVNTNTAFITRVQNLKRYLLFFYNSSFMQMMKTEKNVRNPIILTNIIRKNPYYNHCYGLYKFIEKYDLMGVDFKVNDTYSVLNDKELKELNEMMAANYLTLKPEETLSSGKETHKKYNPHIITNTDDEELVYGPYFEGPIEYVRTDPGYLKYLESCRRPTPVHPSKEEATYYGAYILSNKEIDKEKKEIETLLARKEKEFKPILKHFEEVIIERSKEELEFLAEQQRLQNLDLFNRIENARADLVNQALPNEEAKKGLIEDSPFDSLDDSITVDFLDKIAASEDSIRDAYKQIRHKALCFGLTSRISKKGENFKYKNSTVLKIALLGKTLKVHYALNFNDYEQSPIPVENDATKKAFEDTPVLFRVRSPLSVRRGLSLLDDLASKFSLEYNEIPYVDPLADESEVVPEFVSDEEAENNAKPYLLTDEREVAEEIKNPFEALKNLEIIPFETRLRRAKKEVKEAYTAIKDFVYIYGIEGQISKKGETYRYKNKTLFRISIVGKTLIIHFALDPKKYEGSGIQFKDNSDVIAYERIPLALKVNSDQAIDNAKILITDVMKESSIEAVNKPIVKRNIFGFIKKPKPIFKQDKKVVKPINYEEIEQQEEQYIDRDAIRAELSAETSSEVVDQFLELSEATEKAVEKPNEISSTFKSLKEMEYVPFEKRLERLDAVRSVAYKQVRDYILSYGVKPYMTSKCETFRAHNKTYVRFAIVGKTLIMHFALDPKKYITEGVPITDNSSKSAYVAYPTCLKITSESTTKQAFILVDDVMADNGTVKLSPEELTKFLVEVEATKQEVRNEDINEVEDEISEEDEATPTVEKIAEVKTAVEPDEKEIQQQAQETAEIDEESYKTSISPTFKSLKEMVFIPYERRLDRLNEEKMSGYREIKNKILSYGVKSYISSKCEAFRAHNKTYVRFAIVGKTLILHFALDPKHYEGSGISVIDNSGTSAYAAFPTCLKITSKDSVSKALYLVEDVMKENNTPLLSEKEIRAILSAEESKEKEAKLEKEFAADLKSRRNGPVEEEEITEVKKSRIEEDEIKSKYVDDVVEEPNKETTKEIKEEPEKVTQPIDDKESEKPYLEVTKENEPINDKADTTTVEEEAEEETSEEENTENVGKPRISSTFKSLKEMEYIPYSKRLERLNDEKMTAYKEIKAAIESYGIKSYITTKCEAFRAHNMTFVRSTIVGKTLILYFALDPKNYKNSPLPIIDNSSKSAYKPYPVSIKVNDAKSGRQALELVEDVMGAHNQKKL